MRYKDDASDLIHRRRNAVLNSAFVIFSKSSIEAVTMEDIAKKCGIGVASVYRYFGTKQELVIAIGTQKWQEYFKIVEEEYLKQNGSKMTAIEELEFYIDSYIKLYENHKNILIFNANFDLYIKHEKVSKKRLKPYFDAVGLFADKFHIVYKKALSDKTVRTDKPEEEMFYTVMYAMLATCARYANGTIYPADYKINYLEALTKLKMMFLKYYSN